MRGRWRTYWECLVISLILGAHANGGELTVGVDSVTRERSHVQYQQPLPSALGVRTVTYGHESKQASPDAVEAQKVRPLLRLAHVQGYSHGVLLEMVVVFGTSLIMVVAIIFWAMRQLNPRGESSDRA